VVKKGRLSFTLRIYGVPDSATQKALEKSLALDVLARL
jgi:hypothetical protein